MERNQFLRLLDELLELNPGTVKGESHLGNIGWNSLAAVGFIAMVDKNFGITVSADALAKSTTVDDLIGFLGAHVLTTK